jgi:hypothetical protein
VCDRDQWQRRVAQLVDDPEQRGLVDDRSGDRRRAVVLSADRQTFQPLALAGFQMATKADLDASGRLLVAWRLGVAHGGDSLSSWAGRSRRVVADVTGI